MAFLFERRSAVIQALFKRIAVTFGVTTDFLLLSKKDLSRASASVWALAGPWPSPLISDKRHQHTLEVVIGHAIVIALLLL